jgi:hypothetical protein
MIGHRRTTPAPPQPTLAMTRCSSQAISWSAAACTKACRALWPPEPRSCRPARRRPGVLRTSDGDTGQTLSSYPVNYPANLGEPASVQAGNTDLVNHVMSQAAACPGRRFILVGYSQGANVVDNSIGISSDGALVGGAIVATIPSSLTSRIVAILQFCNPIRAQGKSITGVFQVVPTISAPTRTRCARTAAARDCRAAMGECRTGRVRRRRCAASSPWCGRCPA